MTLVTRLLLTCCVLLTTTMAASADENSRQTPATASTDARNAAIQQMGRLGELPGQWRGVLQLRRGSNDGAAAETIDVSWNFTQTTPALQFRFKPGSRLQQLHLIAPAADSAVLQLRLQEADAERLLTLQPNPVAAEVSEQGNQWTFATPADATTHRRLTLRRLSEIRWTVLLEEQPQTGTGWRRMFEIGMTRAGERLATAGAGQRLCVVTGGNGTIAVQHDGQTWYVCCEGCRQAFNDDPTGILKSYHEQQRKQSDNKSEARQKSAGQ